MQNSMVSKSQGAKYIYFLTDKEEKPKVQMSYTDVERDNVRYYEEDKPDETMNKEPFQGSFTHSIHLPHESHASAAPASGIQLLSGECLVSAENSVSVLTNNSIQECQSYRIPVGVQPTSKQDAIAKHGLMTTRENYSKPLLNFS